MLNQKQFSCPVECCYVPIRGAQNEYLLRPQVYKRVVISQVEVHEMAGKSGIQLFQKAFD